MEELKQIDLIFLFKGTKQFGAVANTEVAATHQATVKPVRKENIKLSFSYEGKHRYWVWDNIFF